MISHFSFIIYHCGYFYLSLTTFLTETGIKDSDIAQAAVGNLEPQTIPSLPDNGRFNMTIVFALFIAKNYI